ncbi:MAG: hypothetical protein ACJATT_004035 [Myxococcota bacterium]|jgi:hypothetical protein
MTALFHKNSVRVGLLCMGIGCGVDLPSPQPDSVVPDAAYNGEDTVVIIEGSSFYPQVEVNARSAGEADINAGFTARLMSGTTVVTELVSTGLVDFEHLQAVVPAGVEPGLYAVEVEGPTGQVGRLDSAFTVTDTRADRLDVNVPSLVYEVFDTAWIEIQLVDPLDQRVLSDLPIVVSVIGEEGLVEVGFESTSFEDIEVLTDERAIRGRIGVDGRARVGVSVSTPGTTVITISPEDLDSSVADGEVRVLWEPGSELTLDIDLPSIPFSAVAGRPFTATLSLFDQFGNPVFDASEVVLLKNACENWFAAETVTGVTQTIVTLREATGTAGCGTDSLQSVSGPEGESIPLQVQAGAATNFDVVVNPSDVVAGASELNIFVTPVDEFGNLTTGTGGELTLIESTGETLNAECVGTTPIFCTATPTVAGSQVVLTVDDGAGISGTSNVHTVLPGPAVALSAGFGVDRVVAGETATLTVDARDTFGNAVVLDALVDITVLVGQQPAACAADGVDSAGNIQLGCVFTQAQDGIVADVTVDTLTAQADALQVINAALSEVQLAVSERTAVAGEPITMTATGLDAFGNPYIVQTDSVVSLSDDTGSLSVVSISLGGGGSASTAASVTVAGDTIIRGWQDGQLLGQSVPVRIVAASAEALRIRTDEPWAFTNEALGIVVAVVDTYGNVTTTTTSATLSPTEGMFDAVVLDIVDGEATAELTWANPSDETLVASSEALTTATRRVVVVAECGELGPIPAMRFSGEVVGIACTDDVRQALVPVSLAASQARGADLTTGLVVVFGEPSGGLTGTEIPVHGYGETVVRGLVSDANGCGAEVAGAVWLGPDDGTVTGPLNVQATESILAAGAGTSVLTVDALTDCAGTIATDTRVFVRSNRGDLFGAVPTGAGLAMTLDTAGDASATLDVTLLETGGAGIVVVRTASGSGADVVPIVITGDTVHPQVASVVPSGLVTAPVNVIVVTFTEPMLATSIVPESFRIDGPTDVAVAQVVRALDGRSVALTPVPAIDPADGTFSVVVTRDTRDVAGNRLDGTYTDESFDFVIPIGAVPGPELGPAGCSVDTFRIRPDGDDGTGHEADGATLSWTGGETPLWWVLDVLTLDGRRVRTATIPASASDAQWWWNGRDDSQRVVQDGDYRVGVDARDEHGNRIIGCTAAVSIDNEAVRER